MIALLLLMLGVPMCAAEDAPQCVWVASDAGNDIGHDVLNLTGDAFVRLPF